MGNLLSGALALSLFGTIAPAEVVIPDKIRDAVCKTGSYTYDTNERALHVDGKTFYTSVGGKETKDGRVLLYLNLIGDARTIIGLGYAEKSVDISRAGTYKLTPVPPEKIEAARKLLTTDMVESVPIALVQCQ